MSNLKEKSAKREENTVELDSPESIPGLHIIGDLFDCQCKCNLLSELRPIKEACLRYVDDVGLLSVGHKFYKFDNGGITGMVILAESHLSVHTWPEKGHVTIDVYVCSLLRDNRHRAKKLFKLLGDLFVPMRKNCQEIERL